MPDVNLYNKADLPASPFQTERDLRARARLRAVVQRKRSDRLALRRCARSTARRKSSDGRYTARDGRIVVNPGKGLAQLRTMREFPHDFHLKLEFRAGVNADSGIFLREPQLQCRDYLVAGPYKELKKYKPQDWNEIEVIVKGDTATCTCNGEPLEVRRQAAANRADRAGSRPRTDGISPHSDQGVALKTARERGRQPAAQVRPHGLRCERARRVGEPADCALAAAGHRKRRPLPGVDRRIGPKVRPSAPKRSAAAAARADGRGHGGDTTSLFAQELHLENPAHSATLIAGLVTVKTGEDLPVFPSLYQPGKGPNASP